MKKSLATAIAFCVLAITPVASFAQSAQPASRAQVDAELVRLEQAGYNPHDWVHYPENIRAAEAKVAAEDAAQSVAGAAAGADGTFRSAATVARTSGF